jgi:hypothetical protein
MRAIGYYVAILTLGVWLGFAIPTTTAGCAHPPPNLNPAATAAWHQHELQKDLDIVRDVAQDASAQGVVSVAAARKVTQWHRSAIVLVHEAPNGWRTTLLTSLDQLQADLPAADYAKVARYVALARVVIQEVQ